MKIRSGFVSNSSSSSFVILGIRRKEKVDFENEKFKHGIENIYLENEGYVTGKVIASGSDYEFPNTEFAIEQLLDEAKIIAEELNVDLSQVTLITGTMYN